MSKGKHLSIAMAEKVEGIAVEGRLHSKYCSADFTTLNCLKMPMIIADNVTDAKGLEI